jgi:hypothetical protein
VFDSLLPEPHNQQVTELLFLCAYWHSFAKLRMHTDLTLDILDQVTSELGEAFRHFKDNVCPAYSTRELKREAASRHRRQVKKAVRKGNAINPASEGARSSKVLNLQTFKYHSLGDYVETIRRYGTTDSYSTESVRTLP